MAIPSTTAELSFPQAARAASVDLGRQDYLSTLWRLTRMELYKLRHRTYSRVVLGALLILIVLSVVLTGISSLNEANTPAANLAPQECSAQVTTYCTTQHYSQAQLAQIKEATLQYNALALGFPGSLSFVGLILSYSLVVMLGLLLLAPLIGTEYSLGTIRQLFTRGPTRLQCMLGKVLAGLIYTAGVLLLLALVYIVVGMLFYPMTGEPYSYAFGHFHDANFGAVFGEAVWLIAISIVYWYAYGVLAIFFATLGRNTAAALGGVFAWFILENLLPILINNFLLNVIATGPVHDLLKAIPDYLFLANLSVLARKGTSSLPDLHAGIVVSVYFVLLIGVSCLITMRRDITN